MIFNYVKICALLTTILVQVASLLLIQTKEMSKLKRFRSREREQEFAPESHD